MIKIVCTACQKPLSLDETKLPMKEVSFPCPVCKAKITVDRRTLEAEGAPSSGAHEHHAEDDDAFAAKALLVGNDHPALRQAAKLIGFHPVHYPTSQEARDFFMQEFPQVVMIQPPQMTPPPLEAMQPIIALAPADRRKAFFILFADNLRTLDGNAAFLYGVNLVVAPKDLGAFPQIYREAFTVHERLYAPMHSVLKQLHG
ncbi:MAG: hypothetical protein JOZ54_19345 [Acidobacteria bacterium]|nr:hypothetical protein [Acidobacteriota bacterium]